MTFQDAAVGNMVSLNISNQDGKIQLTSRITNIIEQSLIIEPLTVDGAIVTIPNNVDIELLVVRGDGEVPLYWQKIRIEQKTYHDQEVHVITSKLPGVRFNRRSSFRVSIGAQIKVSGIGKEPMNLNLRDLSANGFSLMVPKDLEIEFHKKISMEYLDRKNQKFFELGGRPIRKSELNGMMVYGGVLDKRNPELEAYLAQKQMENRPNAGERKKI